MSEQMEIGIKEQMENSDEKEEIDEIVEIDEMAEIAKEQPSLKTDHKTEGKKDRKRVGKAGFYRNLTLFLAFFAPFVIMLAIFAGNSIYPFGDRSFLVSDMYHQYMPFFQEFVQKVRAGEGLSYSYNLGMGSNFLALYGYYLASPLHWLAFLLPVSHIMEFISYLVVVKIGLMGLCACLYLRSRIGRADSRIADFSALVFSCFYAMSGFVAAYNYNIMWLDCIILVPIVLMGLERLSSKGKMGLYILSLGLCIFTNFYISIMICIFLVIYFAFLFLTGANKMRMLWQFILSSLLAGGLASIILIPEVAALLATDFGDMDFPLKWKTYFSVLEILARHCMGVTVEKALDHWPNIYCGCAVFVLIPLYAVNEEIPAKKRFGFLAICGIFLLSFQINGLDFIWHGFNYPDSLPARQSFIYILMLLVMCHDCLGNFEGIDKKSVVKAYLGAVAALLLVENSLQSEDFHTWDWLLTLGFVTAYAIFLYLYKTKKGFKAVFLLSMFGFVFVMAECAVNMSLTSVGTVDRAAYFEHVSDYKALYDRHAAVDDFQRFEKEERKTKNDATLAGFPSASLFSSTLNSSVMDFYTKMGMRHSKVYYCYDGATAFSSALLNVGYLYSEKEDFGNDLYQKIDEENGIYLYEANYQLPFGYVAPKGYDLPEGLKYNGISMQNEMVEKLGIDGILLQKVKVQDEGNDIVFTPSKDGIYYGLVWDYGTSKIKLSGEDKEDFTFKDLKKDCIIYLGFLKENESITLTNGDKEDQTQNISVAIYRLNTDVLAEAIEQLRQTHLTGLKMENTKISGHLSLSQEGKLITTIPYERGWKVFVNGEQREPEKFGGAFVSLDLEAGEYDIQMDYVPLGQEIGRAVSCACIGVMVLWGILGTLWNKRKKVK